MRVVRVQLSAWPTMEPAAVRRLPVRRLGARRRRLGDIANPDGSATITTPPLSTGASGTGSAAPLATNSSNANGSLASALAGTAWPIPSDLEVVLDNATALLFRQYAAINPADFQAWLSRYAQYLVLRSDLFVEKISNPPSADFELTPGMLASMGNAAYKVGMAIQGVAVGRSVDIFGVSASVAGQIPGINQDFVSSLQGLALGYKAIKGIVDVTTLAAQNSVTVLNLTAGMGAYPGLANVATFSQALGPLLIAVGAAVDIGFTIIGDKPDLQKAIDVALDVATIAVLFIPVIGVVIAVVIQLVKFIIDLFGEDLFGGGMSHEQREILETARYSERLSPIFPELAAAYTPRELWAVIVAWGSGYCGGAHNIAMGVNLILKAGDQVRIGGRPYTVPPDTENPHYDATYGGTLLGFGRQPCYWLASTPFHDMTDDEQAWALGRYATQNGIVAGAQAGIREDLKTQFNVPVAQLIQARAAPMASLLGGGYTLDQIDWVVAEYRAQPALNAFAQSWAWPNWQAMLGDLLQEEWQAFTQRVAHGTLTDFARAAGYPTLSAYRTGAFASYRRADDRMAALEARVAAIERWYVPAAAIPAQYAGLTPVEYQMLLDQQSSYGGP